MLTLPFQFIATFESTAHLIPASQTYPPRLRRMRVHYDYVNKRARVDVLSGLDEGKNYTRRYDLKTEVRATSQGCERAYLGEDMPEPVIPGANLRGDHWVVEEARIYARDGVPSKLTTLANGEPLMTFEILDFEQVAPSIDMFATPTNCTRHVGGWPYFHLFHHYLRV